MKKFNLDKAKACPFCGSHKIDLSGKSKLSDYHSNVSAHICIYCRDCNSYGPRFLFYGDGYYEYSLTQADVDKVIELWNKRS